jgi:hypothetical protein
MYIVARKWLADADITAGLVQEGSIAVEVWKGCDVVGIKKEVGQMVGLDVELITVSRLEAYGEYAPYKVVNGVDEFLREVQELV